MRRRKYNSVLFSVFALALLIIVIIFLNSVRRTAHISINTDDEGEASLLQSDVAPGQIAVTPETVQRIIETLKRPESCQRTVTVRYYWQEGSSGAVESTVSCLSGYTRIDTRLPDGLIRHCITDGESSYLWYGAEREVKELKSDEISADDEQMIPTYEDVLQYAVEDIAETGYINHNGVNCIFVRVKVSEKRTLCYYVSVANGLLTAAEQYEGETLVYKMSAEESAAAPAAEDFTLPDGRLLIKN